VIGISVWQEQRGQIHEMSKMWLIARQKEQVARTACVSPAIVRNFGSVL
jgi:hypothetical protein